MESNYNADCNMQTFTLSLHRQRTEVRFEQYKYSNNIATDEPEGFVRLAYVLRRQDPI